MHVMWCLYDPYFTLCETGRLKPSYLVIITEIVDLCYILRVHTCIQYALDNLIRTINLIVFIAQCPARSILEIYLAANSDPSVPAY